MLNDLSVVFEGHSDIMHVVPSTIKETAMSCAPVKLWTRPFYEAVNPTVNIVGTHKIPKAGWTAAPIQKAPMPDFDLWYISQGEGSACIDDQWYTFEAGDLITLKPGCMYQRERTGKNPHVTTFVHLYPFGIKDHPLNTLLADAWPTRLSLLHKAEVEELFTSLFNAYATRSGTSSLSVKGIALQLLGTIFQELRRKPAQDKPRSYYQLLRAKQLIETKYSAPLKLSDITKYSGLGSSQLSAVFKQQLGYSPIEYLIHVRIKKAKLLLARGQHVKETAYATGFESQHYFSRLFKQKTGMTPTQFSIKHVSRFGRMG